MSERIDEGTIKGAVDFVKIKGMETILMQMKKSICKIDGKLIGTGFFCRIKYDNKDIPCLLTNFHVLDKEYIKKNNKIGISMNDNKINEDIIINEEDIIYQSKRNEYDLIKIKLKDLEEVFSFKVKKHEDDTTKKLVYQAKNDIYFKMDQNKADLIYLSDQVTQMNDDVALVFVDRIAKNYVKKSNLVEEVTSILNYNNDEKKINEKYYQDLRSKIKKNYNKIIKMDASLDKKK